MITQTSPNQSTRMSKAIMESPFDIPPFLCEADWKSLGYLDSGPRFDPVEGTINNTIFLEEKFWGTDEEWDLIQPAVWLASNLFQTPLSKRFIVGLIWDSKRLPKQFDLEGRPSYQFHSSQLPDNKVEVLFQDLVSDIAEFNLFGPYDLKRFKKGVDALGICTRHLPEDGGNFLPGADPKNSGTFGHRTCIWFDENVNSEMQRLVLAGKWASAEMEALHFGLAVTLCHEAAHAVHIANDWKGFLFDSAHWRYTGGYHPEQHLTANEPYYEDSWIAEVGIAWEQAILGGRINQAYGTEPSAKPEFISIEAWPEEFVSPELAHMSRRDIKLSPMEKATYHSGTIFPVSMYFISEMLQIPFWQDFGVPGSLGSAKEKQEAGYIKIPRTIGYKIHGSKAVTVFHEIDATADKLVSSTTSESDQLGIRAAARLMKVVYCLLTDRRKLELKPERVIYREPGPRMISISAFDHQAASAPASAPAKRPLFLSSQTDAEFFRFIYPDMPEIEFFGALMMLMMEDDSFSPEYDLEVEWEDNWEEGPEDELDNALEGEL